VCETYLTVYSISQLLTLRIPAETMLILLLTGSVGPGTFPSRFSITNPAGSRKGDILYPPDQDVSTCGPCKKYAVRCER
jgi:hypothetical protein